MFTEDAQPSPPVGATHKRQDPVGGPSVSVSNIRSNFNNSYAPPNTNSSRAAAATAESRGALPSLPTGAGRSLPDTSSSGASVNQSHSSSQKLVNDDVYEDDSMPVINSQPLSQQQQNNSFQNQRQARNNVYESDDVYEDQSGNIPHVQRLPSSDPSAQPHQLNTDVTNLTINDRVYEDDSVRKAHSYDVRVPKTSNVYEDDHGGNIYEGGPPAAHTEPHVYEDVVPGIQSSGSNGVMNGSSRDFNGSHHRYDEVPVEYEDDSQPHSGVSARRVCKQQPAYSGMSARRVCKQQPVYSGVSARRVCKQRPAYSGVSDTLRLFTSIDVAPKWQFNHTLTMHIFI